MPLHWWQVVLEWQQHLCKFINRQFVWSGGEEKIQPTAQLVNLQSEDHYCTTEIISIGARILAKLAIKQMMRTTQLGTNYTLQDPCRAGKCDLLHKYLRLETIQIDLRVVYYFN